MLENAADVESTDPDGKTSLSLAAANGQVAVVKLLLENGADVNAKEKGDHTPLACAVDYGSADI